MKNTLTAILLAVSILSFGQLEVNKTIDKKTIGEHSFAGETYVQLFEYSDSSMLFLYRDMNFQQLVEYKSFSFKNIDGTLDSLYNIIIKGLEDQPDDAIILNIGKDGDRLAITFQKSLGVRSFRIAHYNKAGVRGEVKYMTKKHLVKLFGKG